MSLAGSSARRGSNSSVLFRWLGTAGIELLLHDQVIVIDPYFSRVPRWKLWLGTLSPARALIAKSVPRCDLVLVTHAHFDHIMDVPDIVCNTGAKAVGSRNSCQLLKVCGILQEKIEETNVGDALALGDFGIRVRQAKHRTVPGFSPGPLAPDLSPPLRARDYRMDNFYSFLILVNGLRLLTDPGTRPEDAVAADVLFVYPGMPHAYYEALLRLVRPRLTVPIHWEDFFRPMSEPLSPYWKPPALAVPPMPHLDLRKFRQMLEQVAPQTRVLEPEILCTYDLENLM